MFQNYQANVVKKTGNMDYAGPLKTTTSANINLNSLQRYADGGVNGISRQIQFDSTNDNVIMSFDGSVFADSGNDFVAFVYTYAASEPLDGEVKLPNSLISFVPFFNTQGSGCFQGNVLIPRLQLESGEQQYVMVGVCSPTSKAGGVSMYIDMKLHLSDQQVFQPSK